MNSLNWQEIRNLLAAIDQSDVVEFSLEAQDFRLTVVKKGDQPTVTVAPVSSATQVPPEMVAPAAVPIPAAVPVAVPPAPAAPTPPAAAPGEPPSHWVPISAPMVGTFYAAPAPEDPPFVSVGDRVTVGQTVCIIEAMKLMNELEAEVAGRIVDISINNAEPVEFGQVLMYIDPSA